MWERERERERAAYKVNEIAINENIKLKFRIKCINGVQAKPIEE